MFAAIDRGSRFAFVRPAARAGTVEATQVLRDPASPVPYRPGTVRLALGMREDPQAEPF